VLRLSAYLEREDKSYKKERARRVFHKFWGSNKFVFLRQLGEFCSLLWIEISLLETPNQALAYVTGYYFIKTVLLIISLTKEFNSLWQMNRSPQGKVRLFYPKNIQQILFS